MKTMAVDKDIVELELRVKLQKLHEENIVLRDELERHEGSIDNLKQQHNITEKQLCVWFTWPPSVPTVRR